MGCSSSQLKQKARRLRPWSGKRLSVQDRLTSYRLGMPLPERYSLGGYRGLAYVARIIDGDTIDVVVVFPPKDYLLRIRMADYDSPELHPRKAGRTKKDLEEEKRQARLATDFLKQLIDQQIVQLEILGEGKYGGRWIGRIWFQGESINQRMLKEGHGVPYPKSR